MLKNKLPEILPTHIAFIMDGNRRWAVNRGLNKMLGHRQGAVAMKNIVKDLLDFPQIKYASFFAFSTENWNRDQKEIDYIFKLVTDFLKENEEAFANDNIKIVSMGSLDRFPEDLRNILIEFMEKTKNNTGLVVNLAMNYGGRDDIVHAVNKLIENGAKNITVEDIQEDLYSYPAPDIDLVVRTGGELRISNFMLFQMAYSELYFPKIHWPDFNKKELVKALKAFAKRNRRFGGQ